jgi:hypothetical protein
MIEDSFNRIKIDDSESNKILDDLSIYDYSPIKYKDNNLLICKVGIDNTQIFFETGFLQIVSIESNKVYVKLNLATKDFISNLEITCKNLLQKLLNTNENIKSWNIDWNFNHIDYISSIRDDDIFCFNINSKTNIKYNNDNILVTDIQVEDLIAFVIGLDYITFLVDTHEAKTKLFTYFAKVNRIGKFTKIIRPEIKELNFESKLDINNVFIKTNITADDNIDFKTENKIIENNEVILEKNVNEAIINNSTKKNIPKPRNNKKKEVNIELNDNEPLKKVTKKAPVRKVVTKNVRIIDTK